MFSFIIITFTHRFLGEVANEEGDIVIQEGLAHVEHAHYITKPALHVSSE